MPPLRLVIPRNYPAGAVTVERAVLDLGKYLMNFCFNLNLPDSFSFDDLQNTIHEQLGKQQARGITDILNIWVYALIIMVQIEQFFF